MIDCHPCRLFVSFGLWSMTSKGVPQCCAKEDWNCNHAKVLSCISSSLTCLSLVTCGMLLSSSWIFLYRWLKSRSLNRPVSSAGSEMVKQAYQLLLLVFNLHDSLYYIVELVHMHMLVIMLDFMYLSSCNVVLLRTNFLQLRLWPLDR